MNYFFLLSLQAATVMLLGMFILYRLLKAVNTTLRAMLDTRIWGFTCGFVRSSLWAVLAGWYLWLVFS